MKAFDMHQGASDTSESFPSLPGNDAEIPSAISSGIRSYEIAITVSRQQHNTTNMRLDVLLKKKKNIQQKKEQNALINSQRFFAHLFFFGESKRMFVRTRAKN